MHIKIQSRVCISLITRILFNILFVICPVSSSSSSSSCVERRKRRVYTKCRLECIFHSVYYFAIICRSSTLLPVQRNFTAIQQNEYINKAFRLVLFSQTIILWILIFNDWMGHIINYYRRYCGMPRMAPICINSFWIVNRLTNQLSFIHIINRNR